MSPQTRFGETRVFEALGLSKPLHVQAMDYARENPEKVGLEVALTVSGLGNIVRGGRMTYSGVRAVQASGAMRAGFPKALAAWQGSRKIIKGSRISRKGQVMVAIGGTEFFLDPDIPFVPFI